MQYSTVGSTGNAAYGRAKPTEELSSLAPGWGCLLEAIYIPGWYRFWLFFDVNEKSSSHPYIFSSSAICNDNKCQFKNACDIIRMNTQNEIPDKPAPRWPKLSKKQKQNRKQRKTKKVVYWSTTSLHSRYKKDAQQDMIFLGRTAPSSICVFVGGRGGGRGIPA